MPSIKEINENVEADDKPDKDEASTDTISKDAKCEPEPIPMKTPAQAKYDWYQTETDVIVTILLKGVKCDDLKVNVTEKAISVSIKRDPPVGDYSLELDLAHPVSPEKSSWKALSTKVEIKLRKTECFRWSNLEGDGEPLTAKQFAPEVIEAVKQKTSSYPTSSKKGPINWDALEKEVMKEEEDTKLEGDAAVNQMFSKIYRDSSDEVKKAMMKSYQESAGTCLSTNWDEVKKDKVKITPPDCMEFKKYD